MLASFLYIMPLGEVSNLDLGSGMQTRRFPEMSRTLCLLYALRNVVKPLELLQIGGTAEENFMFTILQNETRFKLFPCGRHEYGVEVRGDAPQSEIK